MHNIQTTKAVRALVLPRGVGAKQNEDEFNFRVIPREELERGYQIPKEYIDAANITSRLFKPPVGNDLPQNSGVTGNPPNNPYDVENLETLPRDPSTQIPRGSLNQPSPQDMLGRQIAQMGDATRPRYAGQQSYSSGYETRPRFVGEPTLEDEIEKNEAYLKELRLAPVENKNSRWKSFLKSLGYGLSAFGKHPVGNWSDFARAGGEAVGTGLYGLFDKSLDERFDRDKEIQKTESERKSLYGREDILRKRMLDVLAREKLKGEIDWLKKRPDIEQDKIQQRAKDARARVAAGVFNKADEFDPEDPKNADTVEMMRDYGLPVIAKKRGQQIKIIQDLKTGEWSVISSDKGTGESTASPVTTQEGKPLVTTSKEKFQQDWRTAENDKQRKMILQKAADDRAAKLQIAEKKNEEAKRKGEYSGDSYFREIDNQLSDVWGELSQLQAEISKRKTNGEEIPDWMNQRQASLRKEARRLELIVAKEQDKMRKAGNVPMPESDQNPTQQKRGMPRKNIPELMKRKGFKTEQEAIEWLKSQGIIVF